MRRAALFVEDFGHEEVIVALIERLGREFDVALEVHPYSVRGGHGRAISELESFMKDLRVAREIWPDLLVVAIDANCLGYSRRTEEIERAVGEVQIPMVFAVPDPHIERWLLLDSAAFKSVLGYGCNAPDQKCDRDRYKEKLALAVRQAGLTPLIGGIEHARDIVEKMDLTRMKHVDKSLGRLIEELQTVFREWSRA